MNAKIAAMPAERFRLDMDRETQEKLCAAIISHEHLLVREIERDKEEIAKCEANGWVHVNIWREHLAHDEARLAEAKALSKLIFAAKSVKAGR